MDFSIMRANVEAGLDQLSKCRAECIFKKAVLDNYDPSTGYVTETLDINTHCWPHQVTRRDVDNKHIFLTDAKLILKRRSLPVMANGAPVLANGFPTFHEVTNKDRIVITKNPETATIDFRGTYTIIEVKWDVTGATWVLIARRTST